MFINLKKQTSSISDVNFCWLLESNGRDVGIVCCILFLKNKFNNEISSYIYHDGLKLLVTWCWAVFEPMVALAVLLELLFDTVIEVMLIEKLVWGEFFFCKFLCLLKNILYLISNHMFK